MKTPLHPILRTDKFESLMIALTGEGPFRSNVYGDSIQISLFTLLIGYFHELALAEIRHINRIGSSGDESLCHNVGADPYGDSPR